MANVGIKELRDGLSRYVEAVRSGGEELIITDRGRPSHVLMTYDEFERLSGRRRSLVEALAMSGLSAIDFEPRRVEVRPREVDLF